MTFCPLTIRTFLIGVHLYSPHLEIKDKKDKACSALILDFYLEFDMIVYLRIYDARFDIINFLRLSRNISTSHAYGINIY